jgi:hypothetical protein
MKMRKIDLTRWHWTITTLGMRHTFAVRFGATICLALLLLIIPCIWIVRAHGAQLAPTRFRVETRETATLYVGKKGKFNIVLLDQYGNRLDAPNDFRTTITVTTLDTLDQAKEWLASKGTGQKTSQQAIVPRSRGVTLGRGQPVARIITIHRKGEQDESIDLLSYQPGTLHIYVESQNIATGETVVIVLETKLPKPKPARRSKPGLAAAMIVPALFQGDQEEQLKLDFQPQTKPILQPFQGDQVAAFKVALWSARDDVPVKAPQDLLVVLRVVDGYAKFLPDTLIIHRGEVIANEAAELRTRPGGDITINASTSRVGNIRIIPVSRTYHFEPGIRSTSLSVQKQRDSAYANGLDAIELRVEALQDVRAITPEEEGMEERRVFFRFIGDSQGVKLENNGEVRIPKGQQTGTIKLFSARPVSDLKVVAESRNGMKEGITSGNDGIPVSFSFPWFQLVCAMGGGVLFPLLLRRDRMKLAQGLVVGVIFFGLALFGAVLSDPQKIGTISIVLTKLPTENSFASFILGFLGSVFLGVIFKVATRTESA